MTLTLVDAFADRPFTGNPAAVCVLAKPADAEWMQALAAEMNLSETAFLVPADDAFGLRWFTPTVEESLCGHATLASAHALYESGALGPDDVARFDTLSGRLTVRRMADGALEMDFPSTPPEQADAPVGLSDIIDAAPRWVGRSRLDWFAEVDDEAAVRGLTVDLAALTTLGPRGLIVTARADADAPYDVVSRFFAPAAGVPEDPVTGSAHCAIAPYWSAKLGTDTLRCYQASQRGGHVGTRVDGDRVVLTGRAVTVGHLALSLPTLPPS